MSKCRAEIVGVNSHIVPIPLFRVDVPVSSEGIRLSAKLFGTKADNEIELVKIFRPPRLTAREDLHSSDVLQVLVICNNVDGEGR